MGVVETDSGERLDLLDPDPAAISLADLAAGLARTCRFGGQCGAFYSVASHSIHVSNEVGEDPRLQAVALFHDAAEAYVGDVPRPLKRSLEGFEAVEADVLAAVWTALGVAPPTDREWERVMAADDRLLAYEAGELLVDGSWAEAPPDRAYDLRGDPERDRERFRARAREVLARVDGNAADRTDRDRGDRDEPTVEADDD